MPLGAFRLNGLGKFQVSAAAQVLRSKKSVIAFGNAQVDTAQSKFNGASALFDGTGDYLRYQPSTTELQFSTNQDFTIELFVRMNSNNNTRVFWTLFDGTTARAVLYTTSTQLSFYAPALGGVSLGDFPSTGVWYHLAVSRSGNTTKIFYNGTETYSTTTAWTGTADRISFGTDNESTVANPYDGWMDEIRISNTARYTANFTPSTVQFSNDANTLLLLHCDGTDASTYFEDDNGSTTQRTITANYNAQISTAQSKFGSSSLLFDGSGDSITITPTADFAFANQDFTVEFWARWTSLSGNQNILDFRPFNTNGPYMNLGFYNGNTLYSYVNNAFLIQGTVTISTNTWYHVAISRSGTSTRLFFNGTQVGSTATDSNVYRAAVVSFGDSSAVPNNIYGFPGYLDEIRVSKSARYTANFTPSTTAFTVDENTTMLLHCEGTNGSTTVTDDVKGRSMNQPRALGNAQISTAQSQFGGTSLLLDGTGDYLQLDSNLDFGFGSGDFTIECWARKSSAAQMTLFDTRTTGTQVSVMVESNAAGNLRLFVNGSYVLTSSNTMTTNTWTHLAITRSDTTTRFFINGTVSTNTYTDTNNYGTTKPMFIGATYLGGTAWNGYLDEIRVSKSCRYTSTFTPSTSPFVNDVNTKLLLHCDGTNASTVIRDDNGVGRAQNPVAAIGNAQIDTADSKFGSSSALFDGTGDYLTVGNTGFQYTSGQDVTMELWFKLNSSASGEFNGLISMGSVRGASSNEWDIFVMINSSTGFNRRLQLGYNFTVMIGSTTNLSLNTWYHVAATRSGSTVTLWLDGVSQGTTTSTSTLGQNTGLKIASLADGTLTTYCWIDEIRVSNIARYTANFTPSTIPFQNDSNTQLLIHCDGTDASTVFNDDNGVIPA